MVPVRLAVTLEVEEGVSLYPVEVGCWSLRWPTYHSRAHAASPGVAEARGWGVKVPPPLKRERRRRKQRRQLDDIVPGLFSQIRRKPLYRKMERSQTS